MDTAIMNTYNEKLSALGTAFRNQYSLSYTPALWQSEHRSIIQQQRNIESYPLSTHLEMDCVFNTWNQMTETTRISP